MTHTYATMQVSHPTYEEIIEKLTDAGYHHAFNPEDGALDMHGIGIVADPLTSEPNAAARNRVAQAVDAFRRGDTFMEALARVYTHLPINERPAAYIADTSVFIVRLANDDARWRSLPQRVHDLLLARADWLKSEYERGGDRAHLEPRERECRHLAQKVERGEWA
jgi:hypothetical protein